MGSQRVGHDWRDLACTHAYGRGKGFIFQTELTERGIRRCPERWRIWDFQGTIPEVECSATGSARKEKTRIQEEFSKTKPSFWNIILALCTWSSFWCSLSLSSLTPTDNQGCAWHGCSLLPWSALQKVPAPLDKRTGLAHRGLQAAVIMLAAGVFWGHLLQNLPMLKKNQTGGVAGKPQLSHWKPNLPRFHFLFFRK